MAATSSEKTFPEKTLGDMNAAHLSGAFFALVADSKLLKPGPAGISIVGQYQAGEAWQEYKLQLREMKDFLFRNNLIPATTAKELTIAGPLAPYIAVEGGDFWKARPINWKRLTTMGCDASNWCITCPIHLAICKRQRRCTTVCPNLVKQWYAK